MERNPLSESEPFIQRNPKTMSETALMTFAREANMTYEEIGLRMEPPVSKTKMTGYIYGIWAIPDYYIPQLRKLLDVHDILEWLVSFDFEGKTQKVVRSALQGKFKRLVMVWLEMGMPLDEIERKVCGL